MDAPGCRDCGHIDAAAGFGSEAVGVQQQQQSGNAQPTNFQSPGRRNIPLSGVPSLDVGTQFGLAVQRVGTQLQVDFFVSGNVIHTVNDMTWNPALKFAMTLATNVQVRSPVRSFAVRCEHGISRRALLRNISIN
jgi:hypothetical protein